jgi:hypothetical protein
MAMTKKLAADKPKTDKQNNQPVWRRQPANGGNQTNQANGDGQAT